MRRPAATLKARRGTNRRRPPAPLLPIDFTDILQSYLDRELRQCSKLPLAKPKPGEQRVPRMERIFVELRTTLPVDEATWFDRLGVADGQRDKVRTQLRRQAPAEDAALRRLASGREPDAERAWWAELHRLDDERFAPVAKTLGATRDQVRARPATRSRRWNTSTTCAAGRSGRTWSSWATRAAARVPGCAG
jgi:hypothetical protein